MSPAGLASWRSRSANALITSGASNARFLWPTLTCETTFASVSRAIAWFTAWKLRPVSAVALLPVTMGAPGKLRIKRSAVELARTRPNRLRHVS